MPPIHWLRAIPLSLLVMLLSTDVARPVTSPRRPLRDDVPRLEVGGEVHDVSTDSDPVVETKALSGYDAAPTVGKTYRIQVAEDGVYTVELRSLFTDTYLVLRDDGGQVIAEDDDGFYSANSRIVIELSKDKAYSLTACALHGMRGEYELRLVQGETPELSAAVKADRELEDARSAVRTLKGQGESEKSRLVEARWSYAKLLQRHRQFEEATAVYLRALEDGEEVWGAEGYRISLLLTDYGRLVRAQGRLEEAQVIVTRALDIQEKVKGPNHTETASSLFNLAVLLFDQHEYGEAEPRVRRSLEIREKELGPANPLTLTTLGFLGHLLLIQDKLDAAKSVFEKSLRIHEEHFARDDPRTAGALFSLGRVYRQQHRYPEARKCLERALEIQEKAFGKGHPATASTLVGLASVLRDQDLYDEARRRSEQAIAIQERTYGKAHHTTASGYESLGLILFKQGRYVEAESYLDRARAGLERRFGPESIRAATVLTIQAELDAERGRYERARSRHERALAIRMKLLGPDHTTTSTSLDDLGGVRRVQGDYAEARRLLERALDIRTKARGPDSFAAAVSYNNLAYLCKDEGNYAEAQSLYERALGIMERELGPSAAVTATVLDNLAFVLQEQGKLVEARPYLEQALTMRKDVLGPDHAYTATTLNNLALALKQLGEYAEAQKLFEQALAVVEKLEPPEPSRVAACLDNLARLLARRGHVEKAHEMLVRAVSLDESEDPRSPRTANSLEGLAVLLRGQGKLEEARPLFERVLSIREESLGETHPDTITTRIGLTRLAWDTGRDHEAWELARETLRVSRARRLFVLSTSSETDALRHSAGSLAVLELLVSLASSSDRADLAYRSLLEWKGQVSRSFGRRKAALLDGLTPEQRQDVGRLRIVQSSLSNLLAKRDPEIKDRAEHENALRRLRRERIQREGELLEVLNPQQPESVTPAQLVAALPSDSVALDYYVHRVYRPATWIDGKLVKKGLWGTPRLGVWIVKPGAKPLRLDLGPIAPVESAIQAFLRDLVARRGPGPGVELSPASPPRKHRVRELLWDPVAEHTRDRALILLAPDGALGTLPFETLQTDEGRFLIEDHGFVYFGDLTSIVERGRRRGTPDAPSLVAVGAIDYLEREAIPEGVTIAAATRGPAPDLPRFWPPLSQTRPETDGIQGLHERTFPTGSRLLIQESAATEERLKQVMPRANVLHLATHGYFQQGGSPNPTATEENPEKQLVVDYLPGFLAGLVCAGANRPQEGRDNGLLTAEEVAWTRLDGCDLVVLSACESALGTRQSGEGMMSLRRAFRQGGAATVVSSLWRVRDDSTMRLMLGFYQRLWVTGQGKLEALRGAQLEMLEWNRRNYGGQALPSSWGAFVLSGDWR